MAAAATARALFLSRAADLSPKPQPPPPPPHQSPLPHLFPSRRRPSFALSCVTSGGGGNGVSDDSFVSTRKSRPVDRGEGFSVIANMVKRIEPLDNSVISKGVSDSAKDSMKQTISTMLGLLPSDHFSVSVTVSKHPLHSLLISAIITGYTLWNAEYRMQLMRNLDMPLGSFGGERESNYLSSEGGNEEAQEEEFREKSEESGAEGGGEVEDLEVSPQVLRDLSQEALNCIQQLQSELCDAKEELNARKQETRRIEYDRGNRNDLLEYLRSLDSVMVTELSRPSSVEVKDIIHQLVQNILRRFFKDDPSSKLVDDSAVTTTENRHYGADEFCETICTSRDYLAKLLFWCMLLGHHLRGLENRLHLSCVVGLL